MTALLAAWAAIGGSAGASHRRRSPGAGHRHRACRQVAVARTRGELARAPQDRRVHADARTRSRQAKRQLPHRRAPHAPPQRWTPPAFDASASVGHRRPRRRPAKRARPATIAKVLATPCQNTAADARSRQPRAGARRRALPDQPRARTERQGAAAPRTRTWNRPPKATARKCSRSTTSPTSRRRETPVERIRTTGYIPNSEVGYVIGENLAWGTLHAGHPAGDRQRLDRLARAPREHPRRQVPRHRDRRRARRCPKSLAEGVPGAIYAQEFGVIVH